MTGTAGTTIHLVRHGEVHNPRGVVYADLPGFMLSERGRRQAGEAASHLAVVPVRAVVTSPLERAHETARSIVAAHPSGPPLAVDEGLTEWRLSVRWADVPWQEIPARHPGELEAYLERPEAITFAGETLAALGERMVTTILRHAQGGGHTVFVSHQDPIQAARHVLAGRDWSRFQSAKPSHASVVTMRETAAGGWEETGFWDPEQGDRFPPPPPP